MTSFVFTPSILSHRKLEQLFVGRHSILDRITERAKDPVTSRTRNHTLLVGQRGSGKTHLLSISAHRLQAQINQGLRAKLVWFAEDPWPITTYQRFVLAIAEDLTDGHFRGTGILPPADHLEHIIIESFREHGPAVVFVENLNQILEQFDSIGQQRLRHLLQSTEAVLMVASATQLSSDFVQQDKPFYGFFTTDRLKPFSFEQGKEQLVRIWDSRGDQNIEQCLSNPLTMARLRTVDHLVGGQPRIWSILADSLKLDRCTTGSLLRSFDLLTPYYQAQMRMLSPNRRVIMSAFFESDGAVTVKSLSAHTGIGQRSLSKALEELRERSLIVETGLPDGINLRNTYYEVADPLSKTVFDLKGSRACQSRALVDFLTMWFLLRESSANPNGQADRTAVANILSADRTATGSGFIQTLTETLQTKTTNPYQYVRLPSALRRILETKDAERVLC